MNKVKMAICVLALSMMNSAYAEFFIEFGVGSTVGAECITDIEKNGSMGCSNNPLGTIGAGYVYKGLSIQVEHWSSLTEKDRGLDIVSIKYRFEFFKD